jgi:hypothetical protein
MELIASALSNVLSSKMQLLHRPLLQLDLARFDRFQIPSCGLGKHFV